MKEINWNILKAQVYHCEELKMNILKSFKYYTISNDFRRITWRVHLPISFSGPIYQVAESQLGLLMRSHVDDLLTRQESI